MRVVQSFIIALSMYSKIPMPRIRWQEENLKYVMCFFPVVGIIIGGLMYLIGMLLLGSSASKLFFAGVMTLLPILISGGIHLDGFMDTIDAISSHADREKKLMILKDSHAGAFAILGMGCYLVWNMAVWSEVTSNTLPILCCSYILSRGLSGWTIISFPAARDSGLAKTFQNAAHKNVVRGMMLFYIILAVNLMCLENMTLAGVAAIFSCIICQWYRYICQKQFGGVTGDLAGFFLQICELGIQSAVVIAGYWL